MFRLLTFHRNHTSKFRSCGKLCKWGYLWYRFWAITSIWENSTGELFIQTCFTSLKIEWKMISFHSILTLSNLEFNFPMILMLWVILGNRQTHRSKKRIKYEFSQLTLNQSDMVKMHLHTENNISSPCGSKVTEWGNRQTDRFDGNYYKPRTWMEIQRPAQIFLNSGLCVLSLSVYRHSSFWRSLPLKLIRYLLFVALMSHRTVLPLGYRFQDRRLCAQNPLHSTAHWRIHN